VYKKAM